MSNNTKGKSYVIFEKTNTGVVNLANISKRENATMHTIDFQGDINANKNDILMNCLLLV